jgi:uncharacterized protein YlxW (UPF0749 family)
MTLLISMMERPLDPGYAAAAERRTAAGLPASTGVRTPVVVAAMLVVGLLLTLGAVQLRAPSKSVAAARSDLVNQIESRRANADKQEANLRKLQVQVTQLQAAALGSDEAGLQARLSSLELSAGGVAVTGPGLKVVLDDASAGGSDSADGNPRTNPEDENGTVVAKDIQVVVNGLWQAGAEAIAINGQRLTSRSAIRFAGEAILVNYRPLTRPYTISVIGDPTNLEADFTATDAGAYVRALKDNYGIRVSMESAKSLNLPAATSLTVDHATRPRPAGERSGTPTRSPSTPTTPETP